MKSDDITSRILESLSALPAEDQVEFILLLVSAALKTMSIYRILQVRSEIVAELSQNMPLVRSAIDMIDGQLALREIAGVADWR